ncbi:MAG: ribulose-phosphate 3-epimerase [Actinomycetota bacterium]|jgi:ribulose-phosphate 3-epimerase|nr:ribulose-phosphate 3-epimerase [Actinomycetota bacterium]
MGTKQDISIIPSVLPVDFSQLGNALVDLEKAGVDRIQWDVMDGVFVPNLTFGPDIIASTRRVTSLPFEAHLMIVEPDQYIERYVASGCELLIVHAESTRHLHRTLARVKEAGAKAGVALNPATPIEAVENVADLCDLILVMTVNPGFGGQAYIAGMERKVRQACELAESVPNQIEIEVDGGISASTVAGAAAAGARALVAGSALFRHPGGLEAAVSEIRSIAAAAAGQ